MVAARLLARSVHALLHHNPAAIVGDDEAVQVEVEAVLNSGAVDFGDEPTGAGERIAIEADPLDGDQLCRGGAAVPPATAADV